MAGLPGETFLQHIRGAYHWIAQEFEYLYSQLQGFLSTEHKDDGRHGAITADSVTVKGDVVVGGSVYATNGYHERRRTVAMGEWITVPFNAGNFTAGGGMLWTVQAGDVATYAYTLIGKTMTVAFYLSATSVGGALANQLYIAIPDGFRAARQIMTTCMLLDNGARSVATPYVVVGDNKIGVFRFDAANYSASADLTYVLGEITFEVQ